MHNILFILCFFLPIVTSAQSSTIAELYPQLEIADYKYVVEHNTDKKIDSLRSKLDSLFHSTGNPIEHLSYQFTDANHGYVYGNELGYGIWPFLYKTSDGGKSWKKIFFEPRQYGEKLMKQHFYMFDNNRGILIHRFANNVSPSELFSPKSPKKNTFTYFLTDDGGNSWKKKSIKLIVPNLRYENDAQYMMCTYTPHGEIMISILHPTGHSGPGKRKIEDRKLFELYSTDFGNNFSQKSLR